MQDFIVYRKNENILEVTFSQHFQFSAGFANDVSYFAKLESIGLQLKRTPFAATDFGYEPKVQ
jgi:hypothetical protein